MGNYNEFADIYARETAKMEQDTREQYYALFPDLQGKKLLDIGCGSGQDAEYFQTEGAKVYGIDISEKEIKIAKRNFLGNYIVGSMDNLPYLKNTFDLVTSFYALQASSNVPSALNEMIRVAKPGAKITIVTKHPFRNLLEGMINDGSMDYYEKRNVTSHIFNKTITLKEPGHTLMDYFDPTILKKARLTYFHEASDFPASDQVIEGLVYPTYMMIRYVKI